MLGNILMQINSKLCTIRIKHTMLVVSVINVWLRNVNNSRQKSPPRQRCIYQTLSQVVVCALLRGPGAYYQCNVAHRFSFDDISNWLSIQEVSTTGHP